MKFTICLMLLFAFSFVACEKKDNNTDLLTGEEKTTGIILTELTKAYKNNSQSDLTKLLDEWSLENLPDKISDINNDTIKAVYNVFLQLYSPFDIGRLGNHEWGSGMYEGYNYAIIQNEIYFDFDYDQNGTGILDSIIDFRPPYEHSGKKTLFLTENYHEAILQFLGSEFNSLGTGGIMNPASPTEETDKRYRFLCEQIAIIPGHWGRYWHIETHPVAWTIHFNSQLSKAKTSFRVGYMFGDAKFENTLMGWVMTESAITGIE